MIFFIASAAIAESNEPNQTPGINETQIGAAQESNEGKVSYKQQLAEEFTKHNYRLAVLERIRQLAREEGKADIISKVDKLTKLEKERHTKRIAKLQSSHQ